jgi:hypothetical protein
MEGPNFAPKVDNRVILKSHPLFHLLSPLLSPPYPLFQWYPQSKEILLNLGMKCVNAQGSRVIILVVQVGAVKIYVAVVQALRKKETEDETSFTTKISLGPNYFLL